MRDRIGPRGIHVVVLDDDPDCRSVIRLALEREGYRVREATGTRSIAGLLRAGAPADLLIVDVRLGDDCGFAVARDVGWKRPDLPILFVSGDDGADPGDRPFLGKPFTVENLLARVASLVE